MPEFEFSVDASKAELLNPNAASIEAPYTSIPAESTTALQIDLGNFFHFKQVGKAKVSFKARIIYFFKDDWKSPNRALFEGTFEVEITEELLRRQQNALREN